MAAPLPVRVGIDTGGTFTDVVVEGPDGRRTGKTASTPGAPAEGFLAALDAVGGLPPGGRLHHGTTVGTNAVLTRGGARVVLVVTKGFEDLPWLGRGQRDDLHALRPQRTAPLLGEGLSVAVDERLDAGGHVLRALKPAELRRLRRRVEERAPEAIAICLLHAVRNPAHEDAAREALADLGVPIHASAAACSDPRETERLATVLLDAYVSPVVRGYLAQVCDALGPDAAAALSVMRSDGGRMSVPEVQRAPVRTLLSGPAAGVAAAQALAARLRVARALSFDVGGTSTDVAWIEGDDLPVRPSLRVGPFEAVVPSVGLETVGAGGGSEVHLDRGGALRVGPQSAGADPGPACYGRGGPFALTDAWLLLGRIPRALLGGAFPLRVGPARKAAGPLARAARLSVDALCEGAVRVAAATTAHALRLASVAHGKDPRDATLIAFGGAGPVLAAETAGLLGIRRVIVPASPGTFAAAGTLLAPLRADASEVVPAGGRRLASLGKRLGARVRAALRADGARHLALRTEIDARYAGQAFEVTVPFGPRWVSDFHGHHAARYGFAAVERAIEPVRMRVRGEGREDDGAGTSPRAARVRRWSTRRLSRAGRGPASVRRDALRAGQRVNGPARIEEHSGTTWVPAGWRAGVLPDGSLRLEPAP